MSFAGLSIEFRSSGLPKTNYVLMPTFQYCDPTIIICHAETLLLGTRRMWHEKFCYAGRILQYVMPLVGLQDVSFIRSCETIQKMRVCLIIFRLLSLVRSVFQRLFRVVERRTVLAFLEAKAFYCAKKKWSQGTMGLSGPVGQINQFSGAFIRSIPGVRAQNRMNITRLPERASGITQGEIDVIPFLDQLIEIPGFPAERFFQ